MLPISPELLRVFAQLVSLSGLSFPIFFFGLILQLVFSRWLDWFPLAGRLGTSDLAPAHITGLYYVRNPEKLTRVGSETPLTLR